LLANETRSAIWNDPEGETISMQWVKWLIKPMQSGSISLSAPWAEIASLLNSIGSVIRQQYLLKKAAKEVKEASLKPSYGCGLHSRLS